MNLLTRSTFCPSENKETAVSSLVDEHRDFISQTVHDVTECHVTPCHVTRCACTAVLAMANNTFRSFCALDYKRPSFPSRINLHLRWIIDRRLGSKLLNVLLKCC